MNTEPLTLRQLIIERMSALEKQLAELQLAIETMSERQMRHSEFENLKLQVVSIVEALNELEHRVTELENHKSLASWLFRQTITIGVIVVVLYILEVWR